MVYPHATLSEYEPSRVERQIRIFFLRLDAWHEADEGRSVRQTSAEQQQMDGGCTPSNELAFVAARSWGVDGPPGATGVLSGRDGRKRGSVVRSFGLDRSMSLV